MAGFLVFIVKLWSWSWSQSSSGHMSHGHNISYSPLAQGLVHNNKIKKKTQTKEQKLLKRKARMLKEQEEYRQWRKDVMEGKVDTEADIIDQAIDELWDELFSDKPRENKKAERKLRKQQNKL